MNLDPFVRRNLMVDYACRRLVNVSKACRIIELTRLGGDGYRKLTRRLSDWMLMIKCHVIPVQSSNWFTM